MNKKILTVLTLIVLLGSFLRFWQLSSYPAHLSIDEVAIGYNAYSILKTGKDEHGAFLPMAFKSTGDWKPPVLVYLMVPSIFLFGMNEFAVRLPVAFFASLTSLVVFFLIRKLTKNDLISLLTSFSLAISPWHIFFSRGSFEAVIALFFFLLGFWLFLEALDSKKKSFFLSFFFLVLSIYTYHAERVFVPLFMLGVFWVLKSKILRQKEKIIKPLVFGLVLLLPLMILMFKPEGQTRAKMTFLSQDIEISKNLHSPGERRTFKEKVLDNNFFIVGNFWLKRYLNYYDPEFLFFNGMRLTLPHAPDIGLLYFLELPFFIFGLIYLIAKKDFFDQSTRKLIFLWVGLGFLPASFSNNDQHALRSLVVLPIPQFLVAIGTLVFFKNCLKKVSDRVRIVLGVVISGLFLLSVVYFLELYFVHYPVQFSHYQHFGFKALSLEAWQRQKDFERIIFDYQFGPEGPNITSVPHLYLLFYGQYDPALYQKRPDPNSNDFSNFIFRPIYWPEDRLKKKTLFIGSPWSLPPTDIEEEQILKKVYFKNGNLGFLVVGSKD